MATADPESERPLPTLGQYELLARLGSGSTGLVFKARHRGLKRTVALKVLAPHRMHEAAVLDRFHIEMEALGRLDHPHVARATDAGSAGGYHFLVMEFVDGPDVARVLKARGRLSVADACEVARQAADGLAYVHSCGLVHRDIKPSNLLLGTDGLVRVLDLGLVRLRDRADGEDGITATGAVMGTADFVAPEQVRGSRDVDIRADVYSLGCTLFALLCGAAPFATPECDSVYKKFKAHEEVPPPRAREARPDLPGELAALVDCMLAKEPDARPREPAEVARALAPFCAGSDLRRLAAEVGPAEESLPPVTGDAVPSTLTGVTRAEAFPVTLSQGAGPGGITQVAPAPPRRRARRWLAAGLIVAGIAAAVAFWPTRRPPDPPPDPEEPRPAAGTQKTIPAALPPRTFRPGEWTDLLDRDPVVLAWPKNPQASWWEFKQPQRLLWVHTDEQAVLELARYDGGPYELEVRLRQTPWTGGVGVFVCGREMRTAQEVSIDADCFHIELSDPQKPQLARGTFTNSPPQRAGSFSYLGRYPFPRLSPGEHALILAVGPDGPESLSWDGQVAVPELREGAAGSKPRPGAGGAVGLFVQDSSVTFHSVRLRPRK